MVLIYDVIVVVVVIVVEYCGTLVVLAVASQIKIANRHNT